MTLRRLYLCWFIASCLSLAVGVLFYLFAMHLTYGNFVGKDDFDGLGYFIDSFIVFILSTGLLSALLVFWLGQKRDRALARRLANTLLAFYSVFALFCVATYQYAFIYLNLPGVIILATLPWLAWNSSTAVSKRKKWPLILIGLLGLLLLLGGLEVLQIILQDPYRK